MDEQESRDCLAEVSNREPTSQTGNRGDPTRESDGTQRATHTVAGQRPTTAEHRCNRMPDSPKGTAPLLTARLAALARLCPALLQDAPQRILLMSINAFVCFLVILLGTTDRRHNISDDIQGNPSDQSLFWDYMSVPRQGRRQITMSAAVATVACRTPPGRHVLWIINDSVLWVPGGISSPARRLGCGR